MTRSMISPLRFSRRALVGSGLAVGTVASLGLPDRVLAATAATAGRSLQGPHAAAAMGPTGWRTWHLKTPDELRPGSPGSPTTDEIEAIVGYQAEQTDAMTAAIGAWKGAPANIPWSQAAMDLHAEFGVPGDARLRNLALLHTALSDAALASWDAQLAYNRSSPAATDPRITAPAGADPAAPTFPSAEAALAGAAATVLTYLFPTAAAGRFDDLAHEAVMARIWAGACFPSDADAGLALGTAIGERAVAYGKADGSDAVWDKSTMPTGPGIWQPTPPKFADPLVPLGGARKTWILSSGSAIRPAAPPDYQSPLWKAELAAVQAAVANRTIEEDRLAKWYQISGPFPPFNAWAHELIQRAGLDLPHATRIMAYLSVAYADALTAVWDGKYTWWTSRPITEDPALALSFPTPPYPSFPAGFPAMAGAGSMVVGTFFPEAAHDLDALAWEAARARTWAGIHYMIDNEVGLQMGRQVGRLACALAAADGATGA